MSTIEQKTSRPNWSQVADDLSAKTTPSPVSADKGVSVHKRHDKFVAKLVVIPAVSWAVVGTVSAQAGLHGMADLAHHGASSWLAAAPLGLVAGSAMRRATQFSAHAISQAVKGKAEWSKLGNLAVAHVSASAGLYAESIGWFFVRFTPTALLIMSALGVERMRHWSKAVSAFADKGLLDVASLGSARGSWDYAERTLFKDPASAARAFLANPFDPRWAVGPAHLPLDRALERAKTSWQATVKREDIPVIAEAISAARALGEALELREATKSRARSGDTISNKPLAVKTAKNGVSPFARTDSEAPKKTPRL